MNQFSPGVVAEGQVRLVVHGFRTDYRRIPALYKTKPAVVDNDGLVIKAEERILVRKEETQAVDLVEYSPAGQEMLTRITARVSDLIDVAPVTDPQNLAAVHANKRRAIIEPIYRAWKGGEAAPVQGTPLGAWPGVTQSQANMIRLAGIHSVEDLATASESQILKIRLPNQRDLREMAKRFLAAASTEAAVADVDRIEAENQRLRDEMADMRAILAKMQAQMSGGAAAVPPASENEAYAEIEALRELAREAGIQRVGNKSKETLERELEALHQKGA